MLIDAGLLTKVADFGLSRESRGENDDEDMSAYYRIKNFNYPLPLRWTGPEVLVTRVYSRAADIFAYGCFLHELYNSAILPFDSYEDKELIQLYTASNSDLADDLVTKNMARPIEQILRQCVRRDPSLRLTTHRLVSELVRVQQPKPTSAHRPLGASPPNSDGYLCIAATEHTNPDVLLAATAEV